MANCTFQRPCIYLAMIGVALVTFVTVFYPLYRSKMDMLERHEQQLTELADMQHEIRQNSLAVVRLAISVEHLANSVSRFENNNNDD